MNNLFKAAFVFSWLAFIPTLHATNGQPFQQLQQQIDAMQAQIDALQGGVEVTINCSSETITSTLNTYKDYPGPLTIHINGTCVENVVMNRNDVSINGGTLKAQSISTPAFFVDTHTGITLNNLNIYSAIYPSVPGPLVSGGFGIEIGLNATVQMYATNTTSFDQGVFVNEGGVLNIENSSITNNGGGLLVARSAVARFANMQILNNSVGLEAREQGRLHLGGTNVSTTISGAAMGIHLRRGGSGRFNSGMLNIQNNTRGVRITGHGLLEGGGGVTISNNDRGLECTRPFILSLETLHEVGAFLANAQIINNSVVNVTTSCNPL